MSFSYSTTLSLIEWLAITGFCQSVLILVYIIFRVRHMRQASLAIGYFLTLAVAFGLQFALRLDDYEKTIHLLLWVFWAMGPPMCYLLVLQVAKLVDLPPWRHFWVLGLVPATFAVCLAFSRFMKICPATDIICVDLFQWFYLLGAMAGTVALLALWVHKDLFYGLWNMKGARERYWLVLTLIGANVSVIAVNFLRATEQMTSNDADASLVALGMAFVYLTTTTLFRIYPQPVQLDQPPQRGRVMTGLSAEEQVLAEQIRKLMELDKLYHEPTFSRADLARELNISESVLSRVVNIAFGKSFPKLLNDLRVEDAKRMLQNPAIPIQVVAFEVGFNSLASFNRVFREVTGETPSQYRISQKTAAG
jgi:AraC-like DNA-binding protein